MPLHGKRLAEDKERKEAEDAKVEKEGNKDKENLRKNP